MKNVLIIVCVYLALSNSPFLAGQNKTPAPTAALSIDDVVKMRSFAPYSPPSLSPDGNLLAYAVIETQKSRHFDTDRWARTGVPWYAEGAQIVVTDCHTGKMKELTHNAFNNWRPTWSPDGQWLAFISDRGGSGQAGLWIWDVRTDAIKKISEARLRADQIVWSADSKKIFVGAIPESWSLDEYAARVNSGLNDNVLNTDRVAGTSVELYEGNGGSSGEAGVARSDAWNLNHMLQDLDSINIESGKTETLVHASRIAAFLLSPDAKSIAYSVPKSFEKPGSQQILFDLVVVTLESHMEKVIASDIRFDYNGRAFSWSPDGKRMSFCAGAQAEKNFSCWIAQVQPSSSSVAKNVAINLTESASRPLWDSRGQNVYFVSGGNLWSVDARSDSTEVAHVVTTIAGYEITQLISFRENLVWTLDGNASLGVLTREQANKGDGIYKINVKNGQPARVVEVNHCYSCVPQSESITVSQDGAMAAYFTEDANLPPDLWLISVPALATRQATHLNPELQNRSMGVARMVHWLSDDGEPLNGALLFPSDFKDGTRYPLIVYTYGGSRFSNNIHRFGLSFGAPLNMQLFATRGYAILLPDSPQGVGTPMLDLAKTVLPGVSHIVEMGYADGNKLGVIGHSNGGYSVLSLIVQTNRFKAAMSVDGTGDLISLYAQMGRDGTAYGTSIVEHGQNALGGTPWEVRDRYIENSPFYYLDRVETPVLLVHGSDDTAVPPFLGDEVFVGLRRLGKDVRYAKYQGEGHSPSYWNSANQVDFCQRMLNWFDSHLSVQ